MTDLDPSPQPNGQRLHERMRVAALGDTERQILDALAAGKTGPQIRRDLGIGHTQYHRYLQRIRWYLDVPTTTAAVALYLRVKSDP
jgi:DNA-binding CsgD family transcriptional regulator